MKKRPSNHELIIYCVVRLLSLKKLVDTQFFAEFQLFAGQKLDFPENILHFSQDTKIINIPKVSKTL